MNPEPGPPRKPRPPDLDWLSRLPRHDVLELKADRIAPRKARQRLAENLEKWSLPQLGISAPLVLSEIATNAMAATNAVFAAYAASGQVAAVPPVTLWLYGWPSAVAMLAWDASASPPEPQCAGPDDESGRGLAIIDLMSADWGYYFPAGIGGKITWAIVDRPLSAHAVAHHPKYIAAERKNAMRLGSCSCGFTELADESATDHLQSVFESGDNRGMDGLIHAETSHFTCSCGLTAATAAALDEHFLAVFTPPNRIGSDGRKHALSGLR